jgi:acetyl-CoA C-acetyltransferase
MMGADGLRRHRAARYTTVERIDHVHHAGNSSGIVDGAALMLVGNEQAGRKAGLKPRARIRSRGGDRQRAHHHAHRPHARLPQGAGQGRHDAAADIDLWEINEAFAAVPMKTA